MTEPINIFWFRRDLRLNDNAGLYHALKAGLPVLPLFIFDRNILDQLENKQDARVELIYESIQSLQKKLDLLKSGILVFYGKPADIFNALSGQYHIRTVFTNEDYEPYAIARDREIENLLSKKGISFQAFKDQVIFSKQEVMKGDGAPYTVFTPYSNKWKRLLSENSDIFLKAFPSERYFANFYQIAVRRIPDLDSMGFYRAGKEFPSPAYSDDLIRHYAASRDFPGLDATTHMGLHLRFGTISIRHLAREAGKLSTVFLNELIWRDFYQMILWHFPKVGQGFAFKVAYDRIPWRNNEKEFDLWCKGETGYPLVDAGMRQLNQTGFMHNRVRMVTASFLAKHLLIDWRWGEAYFAEKLLDFDLASNNGGWQWAAGSGCDAAPYFRIFNPAIQQKKFDPEGVYLKKWLPEWGQFNYPLPIVAHAFARDRAIRVYKEALIGDR